ncbi:sensor histidine kinase [Clostridium sp. 'White wine YQ']|uniref:sensor histidine kinase n=1 Tax=Clostridium sp. 'White wine YQ' TaxID=3027474 RepID=UPI002366A536|nr:HAMP domain-containing sensor histidine kinase [Clostridium sp. 'White wine YQ']MDD7794114.1 HAMP domain-containing sensor histidine kinase [Clostridium sp. 'White wine YQ']
MMVAVCVLTIIIILLVIYLVFMELQLEYINKQLGKRLKDKTRQPISLALQSRKLNTLGANINRCLKAEETLRLKSVNEEKRVKELIANISHDLRTPLTAIKGYQQLMEKSELNDNQRNKLEIAQKHTQELGNLIEYFFEYSYLINTEPEISLESINITNMVTECLVSAIPLLEEKNLKLDFEEAPPIYVYVDKEMAKRVIQNLIRNCIQHSSGDIEVKVLIKEETVISFKNPVGNSKEIDVNRIFERFYTGDKARKNSTGLGLSIVKILVEQMGGSVFAALEDDKLDIQVKFPLI